MKGLFVTGTGTNVGKTLVSAALMYRYRRIGVWRYWKPIQTGSPPDDDTAVVESLGACSRDEIHVPGIRLPRPLSPHVAAELSGVTIEMSDVIGLASEAKDGTRWLVEGAGGVLVPLNKKELMIDLIAALGLPAIVAASSQLGTINHTLLTLEALRGRSIAIAGVILNGKPNEENRRAIEYYGNTRVLGEMPPFVPLDSGRVAEWAATQLDPDGLLEESL